MRTSKLFSAAVVAAAGLLVLTPSVATAHSHSTPAPIVKSTQVVAPFNLSVAHGRVLVADGFANQVGRLKADGSIATVVADATGTSGVATSKGGRYLAYTTTVGGEEGITASGLNIWGPRGSRVYADTLAYETANNPDSINHYGIDNPSQCVIDAFNAAKFPYDYTGQIDSHAYSVTPFGRKWIVADAGSNTLWKIDNAGNIRTLSVFPPQRHTVTASEAATLGFPACVIGVTYAFEPVPTDVEVGKDGYLYVTTLPGGPEGPVLGARGKLWKVNPYTGHAWVVAGNFLGATNLAIGTRGEIYVAEYFGGKISVVKHGRVSPFMNLQNVVALETGRHGALWAGTTINLDPSLPEVPGTIVKITGGHAHYQARLHR